MSDLCRNYFFDNEIDSGIIRVDPSDIERYRNALLEGGETCTGSHMIDGVIIKHGKDWKEFLPRYVQLENKIKNGKAEQSVFYRYSHEHRGSVFVEYLLGVLSEEKMQEAHRTGKFIKHLEGHYSNEITLPTHDFWISNYTLDARGYPVLCATQAPIISKTKMEKYEEPTLENKFGRNSLFILVGRDEFESTYRDHPHFLEFYRKGLEKFDEELIRRSKKFF